MSSINSWDEYFKEMKIEWPFSFSKKEMSIFAKLSGDYNPIHLNNDFARLKGFDTTIIYGLLLSTQMSRLIGQELPDKNAILTSIKVDFIKPCYPEDKLFFSATLLTKSESTKGLEFDCNISLNHKTLCKGKLEAIWKP